MSGGSFNYLCHSYDLEDLIQKRGDLADMVDFLAGRGYAKDAAVASAALLARIRQLEVWAEAELRRLTPVWKAAEWWQSCDTGEDGLLRALAEYRGIGLPDCPRCCGTGKEPGTKYHACYRGDLCAQGKDVSGMKERR